MKFAGNQQVFFQREGAETGKGKIPQNLAVDGIIARRKLAPELAQKIEAAWKTKDEYKIIDAIAKEVFANLVNEKHLLGTSPLYVGHPVDGAALAGPLVEIGATHYYCEYRVKNSIHTLSGEIDGVPFESGSLQSTQDVISAIEKYVLNFDKLEERTPQAGLDAVDKAISGIDAQRAFLRDQSEIYNMKKEAGALLDPQKRAAIENACEELAGHLENLGKGRPANVQEGFAELALALENAIKPLLANDSFKVGIRSGHGEAAGSAGSLGLHYEVMRPPKPEETWKENRVLVQILYNIPGKLSWNAYAPVSIDAEVIRPSELPAKVLDLAEQAQCFLLNLKKEAEGLSAATRIAVRKAVEAITGVAINNTELATGENEKSLQAGIESLAEVFRAASAQNKNCKFSVDVVEILGDPVVKIQSADGEGHQSYSFNLMLGNLRVVNNSSGFHCGSGYGDILLPNPDFEVWALSTAERLQNHDPKNRPVFSV